MNPKREQHPPYPLKNKKIMKKIEFRKLVPGDVDVRPATIKDGKATLLCYIDSRSVVELMDSAVGPYNWNMELTQVGDQMVGRMGVWDDEKGTWVVKSDTGSESNIEAGKGLVSDIYKRCIARWGLQDLYTVPRIVVDDDGYGCHFKVGEIIWNDSRECIHITLVNKFGKVMYRWDKDDEEECKPVPNESRIQMTNQRKKLNSQILRDFCSEKKNEEGVDVDDLLRFYKFYLPKVEEGWKGEFKVDRLWSSWVEKRRVA